MAKVKRPQRKMTVEQVLEARIRYAQGNATFYRLAEEFGIHNSIIRSAVLGHLHGPSHAA
jgi:hypothetical protein